MPPSPSPRSRAVRTVSIALAALSLLAAACTRSGARPSPLVPSEPSSSDPAASQPSPAVSDPSPTEGARFVLQIKEPPAANGNRITLKLVNAGTAAHAFTVPEASSSCGRFRWYVALVDSAGQHYDQAWTSPMGPCGHVFIPEHELRFEPGQVAAEVTIDTSRPWYLVQPAAASEVVGASTAEPPKRVLAPGRYAVIVRGGDVTARTEIELGSAGRN